MAFDFTFTAMQTELRVAGEATPVKVEWQFFDEVPPVVQASWRGLSSAMPAQEVLVPSGGNAKGGVLLQILAGAVVEIFVCPRELEPDGITLANTTTPRDQPPMVWQSLAGTLQFAVQAKEPAQTRLATPVITDTAIHKGSIGLTWTHPGCSRFEIRFGASTGPTYAATVDGTDRTFLVPRSWAGITRLQIRAVKTNVLSSPDRSAWALADVQIADRQAWEPWVGGVPGEAVALGWQEGAGRVVALHAARDGRPYVTWPIGFGFWAPPAPIGPGGVVPPGAGIAVVQQAPSVLTALAVGEDKRLTVWWVNDAEAWQGPVAFGPADFPPGTPVSLAKQTDTITVAAAVNGQGAVCIAWTEGVEPWRAPSAITAPGFTRPGASVALARLADDLLALLVVAVDGRLHVAWVDDAGAWKAPVPISAPGSVEPTAGLALSAQGGDIAVAMAMSRETVPLIVVSVAKGNWAKPAMIGVDHSAPVTAGIGLARSGFDRLAAAWVDDTHALEVARVVTGQPWTRGKVMVEGAGAPGSRIGMEGEWVALVDPAGRLAFWDISSGGGDPAFA